MPLIIEKIYKNKLKPILDRHRLFFKVPILNKAIEKKICDELYKTFGGKAYEVIIGGAAFNPDVEKFFKRIGFPYTVGYGMTECAPILGYDGWETNRLYSCGKVAPYMEMRVDSQDPERVPGELQVRGANVMLGYYKNPEEIEAVINSLTYVVDSLAVDDHGQIVALVYPDFHQAEMDGVSKDALMANLSAALPEINKQLPVYAHVAKIEFMPEDFERTPKKSIKRYLYERK